MTRKILMLTMLLAIAFVVMPIDSRGNSPESAYVSTVGAQKWDKKGRKWRRNRDRDRRRYYYGYKNYGQYRRTQVGNRRYRLVRRYYWRDGIRVSRWVRVYY